MEKIGSHDSDTCGLDDLRPDIEESDMVDIDLDDEKERKRMVTELTKSISTRTIARTLIPKVSVLKKTLKMQHILMLVERTLDEVNTMAYFNSIIEIAAWLLGLLWFFAYPTGLGLIWLHFLHIPRGIFGGFISLYKIPKVYELVDKISDFETKEMEEQWSFEQMSFHVRDNFKKYILKVGKDAQPFFLIYFVLSALCILIDGLGLLIQVVLFGTEDNIYEPLFMIATVWVLVYTNWCYFLYIGSFGYRIPERFRKIALKAIIGKTEDLVSVVAKNYNKRKLKSINNQSDREEAK